MSTQAGMIICYGRYGVRFWCSNASFLVWILKIACTNLLDSVNCIYMTCTTFFIIWVFTPQNIVQVDFCKVDLPKVNLPKVDLHKVDFCEVDLCKVDLHRVDLCKVDLCKVDLHRLDLCKVNLYKVVLKAVTN